MRARLVAVVAASALTGTALVGTAVTSRAAFPGSNGPIAYSDGYQIWRINEDGTNNKRLVGSATNYAVSSPAWSPNGRKLAYSGVPPAGGQPREIYVKTGAGDPERITNTDVDEFDPAWSPDGRRIAFWRNSGGTDIGCEIGVIDADGANYECVVDVPYPDMAVEPAWSPDGSRIVYAGRRYLKYPPGSYLDIEEELYSISVAGGTPTTLTDTPAIAEADPNFSPDGMQLAFTALAEFGGSYSWAIHTMSASGGGAAPITTPSDHGDAFGPAWSPDGTKIAYWRQRSDTNFTSVWVINGDGSGDHSIAGGQEPDWSPKAVNPADADLFGGVYDGYAAVDRHSNRLSGVKVELRRNGTRVRGPIATDETGFYEFRDVEAGEYRLRVTLEDANHDPPVFDVRRSSGDPVWVEVAVTIPPDTNQVNRAVHFSSRERFADVAPSVAGGQRERLDDLANIFYRMQQFVDWAEFSLGATLTTPQLPAPVEIVAFSSLPASGGAHYCAFSGHALCPEPTSIYMSNVKSLSESRARTHSPAPENGEWHEFSHHLFAVNISSSGCEGTNHQGYANPTTCDSISEGVAEFLPTVAWGDITGTADSEYGNFGDLESNGWKAWTSQQGAGNVRIEREEFAVAALLWDLMDDDPDVEATEVVSATDAHVPVTYADSITMSVDALWRVLTSNKATTVADFRSGLFNEDTIPATSKSITVDLDGDAVPDVEPLDIPFLMHGFFPIGAQGEEFLPDHGHYDVDIAAALQMPGTRRNRAIGRTDSFPPGEGTFRSPRLDLPEVPGSYLRLSVEDVKGTLVEDASVKVAITYPEATTKREVVLPDGSAEVYVELPPSFSGILPVGDDPPGCGEVPSYPVSVEVKGQYAAATSARKLSFTNCEFASAVAESNGPFALQEVFEIPRQPGTVTAKASLARGKITVRGALVPARAGKKVSLQLQRKRKGSWVRLSRARTTLGMAVERNGSLRSTYNQKMERKGKGTCRILATWPGDSVVRPDKAKTKPFRC